MGAINLVGHKFYRMLVIQQFPLKNKKYYLLCKCDCGQSRVIRRDHLMSGHTQSCGCLSLEISKSMFVKHGLCKSVEYRTWCHMKDRCLNKNHSEWEHYGGRGIKVCDKWLKFENFYADMGQRPSGRSLDRINNDGNYEPKNCRWATNIEQANNTRRNKVRIV